MHAFVAIVACDERGVIGYKNRLPWHCPEDLEHFYRSTDHHVMIMGYRTYRSLPKRVFRNTTCFVFTRNHKIDQAGVIEVRDLSHLYICLASQETSKTHFVIGGGSLFRFFFSQQLIHRALITHIRGMYEGDVYFPLHFIQSWHSQQISSSRDTQIVLYTNQTRIAKKTARLNHLQYKKEIYKNLRLALPIT